MFPVAEREAHQIHRVQEAEFLPWKDDHYLSSTSTRRREYSNTVTGPALFQNPTRCWEDNRSVCHNMSLEKKTKMVWGESKQSFQLKQLWRHRRRHPLTVLGRVVRHRVKAEPTRTSNSYLSGTLCVRNSICADTLQQTLKLGRLFTYYRMCAFAENHKSWRERDNEIYYMLILFISAALRRNIGF